MMNISEIYKIFLHLLPHNNEYNSKSLESSQIPKYLDIICFLKHFLNVQQDEFHRFKFKDNSFKYGLKITPLSLKRECY